MHLWPTLSCQIPCCFFHLLTQTRKGLLSTRSSRRKQRNETTLDTDQACGTHPKTCGHKLKFSLSILTFLITTNRLAPREALSLKLPRRSVPGEANCRTHPGRRQSNLSMTPVCLASVYQKTFLLIQSCSLTFTLKRPAIPLLQHPYNSLVVGLQHQIGCWMLSGRQAGQP